MLSHPRGVRSRSRFSRNIIRDIDKALPEKNKQTSVKQELNEKKDKSDIMKEVDVFKDPGTIKKNNKGTKSDDKNNKTSESSKKGEKKIDDVSNNTSRGKSVKWDPDILDTKDSKTKKQPKDILKKENETKQDDIDTTADKKEPKKKSARNLFGKNVKKLPKKEKVVKIKQAETGLPAMRKARSIKEQIKSFVKVITPFSKSKRGASNAQQESLNKTKLDEDGPKLTRSKCKEEVSNKSRRISVQSDHSVSSTLILPGPSGLVSENQSKAKKLEDTSEKKKPARKKKDEKEDKLISNDLMTTPISSENESPLKDSPSEITVGDHIVVYYGDDDPITYDAKILKVGMVNGVLKYMVHYKGWNSRYDEWVESTRTALKFKGSAPEPEHDEADILKNEPKNVDPKKMTPTNRTRRSATPSLSNSNRKKSPFSSVRPTRTCTLNDRPLSSIYNSDSESEDIESIELAKQNKRNQQLVHSIKSEHENVIKPESLDTQNDNQKKMYPKTYPSKEVLMQRNVPKKLKSFKDHTNKSDEGEICEQVTLKPPFKYNFEMAPPSNVKKNNLVNENDEVKNGTDKDIQNEHKVAHYLSPKEKSEKNFQRQQSISEPQKNSDVKIEINAESQTANHKITGVIFYQSSSEEDEEIQVKKESNSVDKPNESKISGTDFDLNKIRSEMKGLMPTTSNSCSIDLNRSTESMFDHQVETEVPITPVTDDVYEFTESEPCDFETIPSVTEEKQRKINKNIDPSKLCSFEPPVDLNVIESITPVEVVEQNGPIAQTVSNINYVHSFDNNITVDIKDNLSIQNEIEDPVLHTQSDNESNSSENFIINNMITGISNTNEVKEDSQKKICPPELETDIKDEVLDLCMKPPESPPSNIFSMPEPNEINDIIAEDDDDDDESKLVIAENDKIESDYQMDTNQMILGEETNSSNDKSVNILTRSPLPLPPSVHQLPCIDSEFQSSYRVQRSTSIPKDIDDESTTSCNENIQNALIQSFQMYNSQFENQLTKSKSYESFIDNNDDSTKSGFEFGSNSKSPTIDNTENIESAAKHSIYESSNNKNPEVVDDYGDEKVGDNLEKEILPELQCREEIVDEETLNNALVIEYNRKNVEYDIHKPSTSKGFFDSINQPCFSKDNFYDTNPECDTENSFFDHKQANLVKSVIFDTHLPSTSKSGLLFDENNLGTNIKDNFYDSIPSSSKSSHFYETSVSSTSKSFYNPEADVNNVLFCEETIPGSPTGISEDHYDQEERKRAISQAIYEGREAREAASAMYAMKESFKRPMNTLMVANEKELEEYTNIHDNDGGLLDHRHLQFLAEISSRNLSVNINDPSEKNSAEEIAKLSEKSHAKRKNSNNEHSPSKRNKTSTTPTEDSIEKPAIIPVPLKNGKPMIVYAPDMDSSQRQALILAKMNDLRKEYIVIKSRLAVIDRRRKKIRKRKREMAKVAVLSQNK